MSPREQAMENKKKSKDCSNDDDFIQAEPNATVDIGGSLFLEYRHRSHNTVCITLVDNDCKEWASMPIKSVEFFNRDASDKVRPLEKQFWKIIASQCEDSTAKKNIVALMVSLGGLAHAVALEKDYECYYHVVNPKNEKSFLASTVDIKDLMRRISNLT